MRLRFRRKGSKGKRVIAVERNGKPLATKQVYSIATSGGQIQRISIRPGDTGKVAVEELIPYLKKIPN
jgi:hypothetical protein